MGVGRGKLSPCGRRDIASRDEGREDEGIPGTPYGITYKLVVELGMMSPELVS